MTVLLALWAIIATCLFFVNDRRCEQSRKIAELNLASLSAMTGAGLKASRNYQKLAEDYVHFAYWQYKQGSDAGYEVLKNLSSMYHVPMPHLWNSEAAFEFMNNLSDAVAIGLNRQAKELGLTTTKNSTNKT